MQPPPELAAYLPDYRYWLCDLSQYSDEEIKGTVTLRVAMLLLKYVVRDDLGEHLVEILSLLRDLSQQRTGLEYLERVLRYVGHGTDKVSKDELWKAVETAFPEGSTTMSTPAEQWIQQGLKQGLKQGRQEGRQKGEQRGLEKGLKKGRQEGRQEGERNATLKALRQILTVRFDTPPSDFERRLERLGLPALGQLTTAALTLPTWAEFEQSVTVQIERERLR